MVRAKTSFMTLGFMFTLIACSQIAIATVPIETPTPWLGGTETALAASTPATPNQHVLPTFASPTTMVPPTDFSPVFYGGTVDQSTIFLLLGGVSRETWLAPDISVSRFPGAGIYSLHSFTQQAKYFVGTTAPVFSPTCRGYIAGSGTTLDDSRFVGVLDGWDVTKRPVTELADSEQFYRQALTTWLKAEGVSAPQVDAIHMYRVDIEGDGVDEVFISATHLDASRHTTKAGDYSIILMRQVVGNDAVTKLVVGDLYRSKEPEITYPRTYSLTNAIDLNQDGVLEVVVETQKWEGVGARVFQIDAEGVIQTLGAEC